MNPAKPTRHGTVDGRAIYVYDDLVPHDIIVQIKDALDRNSFVRNEIARPDTEQYRHWARNMTVEAAQQLPLFKATILAAQPFCSDGSRYRLYRAYTNYASYGDMLFTHTDCEPGAREVTALWFIADDWDLEWGGETLFFNDRDDAEFVVSPRPGRVVLFDGSIKHCGRPPNRICFKPRYTFAMKLERVDAESSS
ncbi:MAG: 2OG-Fe(II) oxygenase [Xanthomonadales bacterium]|nr:2OG-Fe(II) oxygenase [Xanthomonadales bacterium]